MRAFLFPLQGRIDAVSRRLGLGEP